MAPLAADANARPPLRYLGRTREVNPSSDLFEKHPDWVIRQPKRDPELIRSQLVLDLTRPEVQEFEWKTLRDILGVPGITYAKWDCNRHITQPGSPYLAPGRQSHLWIDYVRALYVLMEKTAKTFPKTGLMCSAPATAGRWATAPCFTSTISGRAT
jgi:alpha-galactosidase